LLPGLQRRAERLLQNLRAVSLTRPTRQLLDACRITRLNQRYRPSLQLCRLVLEQAGIALDAGQTAAPAFFFPMQDVFQEAVTCLLRDRLPAVTRQASSSHRAITGGPQRTLGYMPDMVVGSPPRLVIDTKYIDRDRPATGGAQRPRALRRPHGRDQSARSPRPACRCRSSAGPSWPSGQLSLSGQLPYPV
jgi:5-methylcytosine-specific restriction endonuclease McrBC regulatory subunit McrC